MKNMNYLILKSIFTVTAFFAVGFSTMTASAAEDSAFAEKARTRQYAGGADESDLKVQANMATSQKVKPEPNQEATEGF